MTSNNSLDYVEAGVNAWFIREVTNHDTLKSSFTWRIDLGYADHVSMSGTPRGDEQNCNICDYAFTIKDKVMDDVSETGTEWQYGSLHIWTSVYVCKEQSHNSGDT